MNITRINANLFAVDSESSDKSYTVNLGGAAGLSSCTCPHFACRLAKLPASDPERECKHLKGVKAYLAALAAPQTAFERAAARAAGLTDEQLVMWAAQYGSGPIAGACRLELASRRLRQPEPKPIPAGVLELLEGASEAERARALEIYS